MAAEKFGSDIRLDRFGDVIFTNDGDLEIVFGGALVAQDLRTELMLIPGSCFWAPEFGRGLGESLKGPNTPDIEGLLRATAFNDERILFDSVQTERLDDGRYLLSFRLFGDVDSAELYFDLKDRFT